MNSIAICIPNYRMGERTDALIEHIEHTTSIDHRYFIIDMVDDPKPPFFRSQYATTTLDYNLQMNGGLTLAVEEAHKFEKKRGVKFLAYWFITTSMNFLDGDDNDIPNHLLTKLIDDPNAVIISPALDGSSGTAWTNMKVRNGRGLRQTLGCDCLATMYRADWFDAQGGYNPDLKIGWGMDMEMSWKARSQGRTIWICEDVMMHKEESVAYKMGRWNFLPEERGKRGSEEMEKVLSAKYGKDYIQKLMLEHVTPEMGRM